MIDTSVLNLAAILRHYVLANTPRYLYRNLRSEPSVEVFARATNPGEILRAVAAIEEQAERSAQDIAIAYAMVVAMSFHDYGAMRDATSDWNPRVLNWAKKIVGILREELIITTVTNICAPGGNIVNPTKSQDAANIILRAR